MPVQNNHAIPMTTIRTAYGELSWPAGEGKPKEEWVQFGSLIRRDTLSRLRTLRHNTGIIQSELVEAALKQFLDAVEAAQIEQ